MKQRPAPRPRAPWAGGLEGFSAVAVLLHFGDSHGTFWILVQLGVLAAVFGYAVHGLDWALGRGVRRAVGRATKLPVTLEGATVPILEGELSVTGLRVGGAGGAGGACLAQVERCAAALTLASLLREVVEVPRLDVHGLELHLAGPAERASLGALAGALGALAANGDAEDGRRYAVGEVVVSGLSVRFGGSGGGEPPATVPIPELRLEPRRADGEAAGPVPLAHLAAAILVAALEAAAREGLGSPDAAALGVLREELARLSPPVYLTSQGPVAARASTEPIQEERP